MKTSKFINIVYRINQVWFVITLGLFITVFLGFLAEIVLGFIQVISSLLIIIQWKDLSKSTRNKLGIYWMVTAGYMLMWLFDWNSIDNTLLFVVGIGIIPMGIALYFLSILRIIRKGSPAPLIEQIGTS